MIVLYLKESPFGLKYLGKTTKDPYKYNGSGLVWKRHIKKYKLKSTDITTAILFQTTDKIEFSKIALEYSILYNIVNSDEFANLTEETGQGGKTFTKESHPSHPSYRFGDTLSKCWGNTEYRTKMTSIHSGKVFSDEHRKKLSEAHIGKTLSDEHKKKIGRGGDLNVSKRDDVRKKISEKLKGHKISEETRRKISETLKAKKLQKI
jgi:hypothetical protein